jgi:hypothetical protein
MSNEGTAALVLDAAEAAFFSGELEVIKARSYDILRRELKHRTYIPVSFEAGPGASTISYYQYDQVGTAKLIQNYAEDLPLANVKGRKFSSSVESIGIGFQYSLQEIRASQMAGKNLPDRQMRGAMRANKELEEELSAFGRAGLFNGFLNHPNVSLISALNPGSRGKRWIADSKSADEINADISLLISTIVTTTAEVEKPNALLMPSAEYIRLATVRIPDTPETMLSWLKRVQADAGLLRDIGTWDKLANADAGGDGGRLVAYDRNPDKVSLEIPQDFEILPAQAVNLAFKVPTHSRFGGVVVYYPLSMCYMDDIS